MWISHQGRRLVIKLLKLCMASVCLLTITACGLTSGSLSNDPGYAKLHTPHFWEADKEIGLSLGPTIIKFAAGFIEDDDEVVALLKNLKGVKLRVYNVEDNSAMFNEYLSETSDQLSKQGWEQLVSVKEDGENVSVLIKLNEESISGVVVLVLDDAEAVFVNLIGNIDPAAIQPIVAGIHKNTPDFSEEITHEI